MGLDVSAAHFHIVSHQNRTNVVCNRGLVHRYLQQRPETRVDGRVPKLGEVHLAEALQALELLGVVRVLCQETRPLQVVFEVHLRVAYQGGVQRGLGDIYMACLYKGFHLPHEKRKQQRADVRPVDVCVSEQDHLVVTDLLQVEVVRHARADREDQRLDLCVLQHLVDASLLDVKYLAADRQDRQCTWIARILRGAERR